MAAYLHEQLTVAKPLAILVRRKEFVLHDRRVPLFSNLSLSIAAGEFVTILGPSGCGKTTLLRMILGLDRDFDGAISIGDRSITKPGLDRGVIFQEPRLLPWLTVEENIAFALCSDLQRSVERERIQGLIALAGLHGFEKAWPNQLSGGMAQRAALARALVNVPDLLLLDEPFGALDSFTRYTMQEELLRVLNREGTTTLMVTHDVDEALYLSDDIVVLSKRPTVIRKTFRVPIRKPRVRSDLSFAELRAKVLEAVYD